MLIRHQTSSDEPAILYSFAAALFTLLMVISISSGLLHAQDNILDLAATRARIHGAISPNNRTGFDLETELDKAIRIAAAQNLPTRGVTVEVADEVGFYPNGRPGFRERMNALACRSDAVLVLRARAQASRLSLSKAAVYSDYTMSVEDVIRHVQSLPIAPRDRIVVTRPGGAVGRPNGIIEFTDKAYPPFVIGQRYLVFLRYIAESQAFQFVDSFSSYSNVDHEWRLMRDAYIEPELHTYQDSGFEVLLRTLANVCMNL